VLKSIGRVVPLALLCAVPLSPSAAFAADTPSLEQMLNQISQRVELFWQRFPTVTCIQSVQQSKLDQKGKTIALEQSDYDYTVSLAFEGTDLAVGESLVPRTNADEKQETLPLLVSQGFSLLILIFHPHFQGSFQFFLEPDSVFEGKAFHRIRFEQNEEGPSLSVLQVHGKDYPLRWQGTAWVDSDTLAIAKMEARLKNSVEDAGLVSLQTEVSYGVLLQGDGSEEPYWLPQTAVVDAQSRQQHWRNVHRFDNYRRFTVDTRIMIEEPQ
jgi:hypothetical protein